MFSDSLRSLITTLFLFKHTRVYVCMYVYICTMCVWIQDRVGPLELQLKEIVSHLTWV